MKKDCYQFVVRLPEGMRDKLKAEAKANNRSINSEIVSRLETSQADHIADKVAERLAQPPIEFCQLSVRTLGEGGDLYFVQARCFGDDDDTSFFFFAPSEADAVAAAREELLEGSLEPDSTEVFIIDSQWLAGRRAA